MRRLYIFILVLLLPTISFAQKVSVDNATTKALNFFNSGSGHNGLRYASRQNTNLSYTARKADEVHFYVFNMENGGWVIIGGDEICEEVLAYSMTGTFDYEHIPENAKAWLRGYELEISSAIESRIAGKLKTVKSVPLTASKTDIEPLIKTQWDQDEPYNLISQQMSGKPYTGCVATSMSQVMNYWQWPVRGTGSHSYYDRYGCKKNLSTVFSDHTYQWSLMKLNASAFKTTEQMNAVAQLMYDAGVSVEMQYDDDGSGAYSDDIETALKTYFNYSSTCKYVERQRYPSGSENYTNEQWADLVYAELSAGRPIIYGGCDNDDGGHSFVCDGYQASSGKCHFNFGWSGSGDGYYSLQAVGESSWGFKYYQDAVIGINPNTPIIYTVTLGDTNEKISVSNVEIYSLPTRTVRGYKFEGWSEGKINSATTTKPTVIMSINPSKNVTLYPVFSYDVTNYQTGSSAPPTTLFSEDFSNITAGNSDGTSGSSSRWGGNSNFSEIKDEANIFQAGGAIRIGTSSAKGSITTKALSVKAGTDITVQFDVKGWTTVEGDMMISVDGCKSAKVSYTNTRNDNFVTKEVSFTLTQDNPKVTFATTEMRAFLDNILITTGSAGGATTTTYYCSSMTSYSVTMSISAAKWGTFYAPFDVVLDDDIDAYVVSNVGDAGSVDLDFVASGKAGTTNNVIPAHTAVLLHKTSDLPYNVNMTSTFSMKSSEFDNLLVGSLERIEYLPQADGDKTNYVLQNGSSGVKWYSVVNNEEAHNSLAAFRAYLSVEKKQNVKSLNINIGTNGVTGINVVRDGMRSTDDCVYDIYGRKVSRSGLPLPKGIYIIGGKKVLR